ncbi:hypothetical protein M758_UG151600 [Ceratodon purpureus]|nr:hypothetical protein M758_UG151600 [Ceratodon purpureus]
MVSAASWESGDTVPVTPNTILQNFSNRMPIGAAVSTEVSASIETAPTDFSPGRGRAISPTTSNHHQPLTGQIRASSSVLAGGSKMPQSNEQEGITTRGMQLQAEAPPPRPPRQRFEVGILPRCTSDAIAANHLCFILHPDHGDTVVAEGKTGGSWKLPSQRVGNLCLEGQQMVQVHKIIKPGLPLIFSEERHPFKMLDEVLVKPSGSTVYVKWYSRLLIKKPKENRGTK